MARYVARVRTSLPVPEAFDLVADMTRFVEWDPGVRSAEQVVGVGVDDGATYDVRVAAFPRDLTLRYVTEELEVSDDAAGPRRALLVARHPLLTSIDHVQAERDGDSTVVVYDAELRLTGLLGLGDLGLRPVFAHIGARADAGLQAALQGEPVLR